MSAFSLPGPMCTVLKDNKLDPGTLCKQNSPTPGTSNSSTPSKQEIEERKSYYLSFAYSTSYLMEGKSVGESMFNSTNELLDDASEVFEDIKDFFGDDQPNNPRKTKPKRVQSVLGGAFLRMFLDHKVDPDIVAKAGEEMAEAPMFKALTKGVNSRLERDVRRNKGKMISQVDLANFAGRYLNWRRKKGVKFTHTLNTVIGGVSGITVGPNSKIISDVTTPTGGVAEYEIDVTFHDTYDFENKRYGVYDAYRKQLAKYLIANNFAAFEQAFFRETVPGYPLQRKNNLDNAALFASFMYALEKRGWTPPPLVWQVTIPMRGKLNYKK